MPPVRARGDKMPLNIHAVDPRHSPLRMAYAEILRRSRDPTKAAKHPGAELLIPS
jgi:hypothetical protein